MKKNGHYVGVDEKFIPEEEKFVEDKLDERKENIVDKKLEIEEAMADVGVRVKDYFTNENNQEKIKSTARKGLKIFKGIGIGYLVMAGIIAAIFIAMLIFFFSTFNKANDIIDNGFESMNKNGLIIRD